MVPTETEPERRIRQDQVLDGLKSPLQVAKGARHCRSRQTSNLRDIGGLERALANQEASARSNARSHDFDWVNGIHVKAMQPRCCKSGEDSRWWQAFA